MTPFQELLPSAIVAALIIVSFSMLACKYANRFERWLNR